MTGADVGILSVVGGLLGLDAVSFPQAMLSRPIVAGTIAGALLGAPERGLLCGATLELFAVDTLPFGASRYPEWGSATVIGAALFALLPGAPAGSLAVAVLAALIMAWVGGWSMVNVRRFNARLARRRHDAVARGERRAVVGLQLSGLTADLVRGMLLTVVGLVVFGPFQELALSHWGLSGSSSGAVVAWLAAAVALGATYKLFHAVPGFFWQFLLGLAGSLILVVLR